MNKKMIRKLVAAIMALTLTVVMVVTVSYAWMTLSATPVAEGIQITIGGGNTILIAADYAVVADGETYHYPGHFSSSLNFTKLQQYDYLKSMAPLTPVSTADGIHWFFPEYYDYNDTEVINGTASVGQLKPIEDFRLDDDMQYANVPKAESKGGNYVYLDFWVVSPASDYNLRVSRGDDNGGSFVLELMSPEGDAEGNYTIVSTAGNAAASARIGFLVDDMPVVDDTMRYYQSSLMYSSDYTRLKGNYRDPQDSYWYTDGYRFTIYEPNGDLHPNGTSGTYEVTQPIGWDGNKPQLVDIRSQLTVQLTNTWKNGSGLNEVAFQQIFATWKTGKNLDIMTTAEIKAAFYGEYLQYQVMPYVNKGSFVQMTSALYAYDGTVGAEQLTGLNQAGATDDVIIVQLEKNVPQRIRMFIWLEGQNIDCTGSIGAQDLALSIELAGSNQ